MTQGVVIWLSVRRFGERLAEFLALLCLCSLGLAVGMLLVPAAGAFVYLNQHNRRSISLRLDARCGPFWMLSTPCAMVP